MADQGGTPVLPEQDFTPEFVVPVNQESVARARRTVVRILRISAWVQVIGGGFIIACGGAVVILTKRHLGDNWPIAMFISAPGLIMLYGARSQFAGLRRIKQTWAAAGIPEVAMHLS